MSIEPPAHALFQFHATLHARSSEVVPGVAIELRGALTSTLIVPPAALAQPFALTFEEAVAALERLERMFVEPDGSWVWVSSSDECVQTWQLDGNLFDRNGRLLFVDLKGTCAAAEFDRLLTAFGWPGTPDLFELAREAVFLGEPEFRRYAARSVAVQLSQSGGEPE
jgi:hypothetical protein